MADRITVQTGVTKNIGNYESVRLDAHYETEIRTGETVEQAFARAWEVAETQINQKVEEIEAELESGR